MTRLRAAIRALPMTASLHIIESCLAAVVASGAAATTDLSAVTAATGFEAIDALRDAASALRPLGAVGLGLLVLWFALTPWTATAWIAALQAPRGLAESVKVSAVRGGGSVLLSLSFAALLALPVGLAVGGVAIMDWAIADLPNERHRDLALLAALAPSVLLAGFLSCWLDLARGLLVAGHGPLTSTGRALRQMTPSHLGVCASAALASACLVSLSIVATLTLSNGLLLVVTGQTLHFLRRFARSLWLADAARSEEARSEEARSEEARSEPPPAC